MLKTLEAIGYVFIGICFIGFVVYLLTSNEMSNYQPNPVTYTKIGINSYFIQVPSSMNQSHLGSRDIREINNKIVELVGPETKIKDIEVTVDGIYLVTE